MKNFFRNLFGPFRDEVWREFSEAVGGEFVPGGFWTGSSSVRIKRSHWTITLNLHKVPAGKHSQIYTRFRTAYRDNSGLRFKLYRRGLFSDIATWFGAQNLNIGYPQFDEQFVLKGNNEPQLVALFANDEIRQLLQRQAEPKLEALLEDRLFSAPFPAGCAELRFMELGVIKSVRRLTDILELMERTLNQLCAAGVAQAQDTQVTL